MTPSRIAWAILFKTRRGMHICTARAYPTRREAKAEFLTWWRDPRVAEIALQDQTYRIAKVRIEVIE